MVTLDRSSIANRHRHRWQRHRWHRLHCHLSLPFVILGTRKCFSLLLPACLGSSALFYYRVPPSPPAPAPAPSAAVVDLFHSLSPLWPAWSCLATNLMTYLTSLRAA